MQDVAAQNRAPPRIARPQHVSRVRIIDEAGRLDWRDTDRLGKLFCQPPGERDVVAVYIRAEGGMLGYWHDAGKGRVVLEKHNGEYAAVPLGHRSEWFLVGTITKIVEAPLPRR